MRRSGSSLRCTCRIVLKLYFFVRPAEMLKRRGSDRSTVFCCSNLGVRLMRKPSAQCGIRRHIVFPASFQSRLQALKERRGSASDSEILRQAVALLDAITARDAVVILRDKQTGKETEIFVP